MRAFAFSDDEDVDETRTEDTPSYALDGFRLEFSDKVALTPVEADSASKPS